MALVEPSQREKLLGLFSTRSILRSSELKGAGITPASIARAVEDGDLERVSRGLYQRCRVDRDPQHVLAMAAMRVPKGVIALLSALVFHQLSDEFHPRVWIAIGQNDWAPSPSCPPLRIVRFAAPYLRQDVENHVIGGINVPVYSAAKTLVDAFRHPRLVDRDTAVQALRQGILGGTIDLGTLEASANASGVWPMMRAYVLQWVRKRA